MSIDRKEYMKNYYINNKKKILENSNIYYNNNLEKCKNYNIEYKIKNDIYIKKDGYIYIILNDAWTNYIKIGITDNLIERINRYQTYSPYRDFTIYYSKYIKDAYHVERYLKNNLCTKEDIKNEWYKIDKDIAKNMIEEITNVKFKKNSFI